MNIPIPSSDMYEIIAINEKIQGCNDLESIEHLYKKYGNYNHPQICYDFGRALSMKGNKAKAFKALFTGASYGIQYPCNLYDNTLIDSIGQCLSDLVTQYPIANSLIATKVTSLSYIYLSRCIELFRREAQDSYRTRAILFKDHNVPMLPEGIIMQNLGMGVLKEPFMISDFYFSSQATNSPFKISGLRSAQEIHNSLEDISIAGKDADDYSLREIAELGENRHYRLFKILEEKYKEGGFNLTLEELKQLNR